MPKLIDVHTHVQFAAYENEIGDVIGRALSGNIWLVNVGTQRNTSEAAITLAEKYEEGVYATVGLHPIHTAQSARIHRSPACAGNDRKHHSL